MAGFGRAMIREEQGAHTPDGQYAFELSETGMLGAGAHGIVRAAQNKDTGEWVAVKLMPTSVLGAITKELIALAKVEHPNIVRLMGTQVDLDNKRVYMVMVRRRPLRPLHHHRTALPRIPRQRILFPARLRPPGAVPRR